MPPRPFSEDKRRCVLLNNCLVVVCRRVDRDCDNGERRECSGRALFQGFVDENAQCFWNQCLVQSVTCLEYRGYLIPSTIFVSGTAYSLEVVRSAWSRRVLRPPLGYEIQRLGDVTSLEMVQVLQTQFAPLAEALCKAVFDVTSRGETATLDTISTQLRSAFPGMERPGSDVVYRALGALIRERRLYHTGVGYQVAAPDTFLQTSLSPGAAERPMLLTNEEAITKLHGTPLVSVRGSHTTDVDSGADVSTLERSASMRLLRSRDRLVDDVGGSRLSRSCSVRLSRPTVQDTLVTRPSSRANAVECNVKRDKSGSMFSRWFRRSRSQKRSLSTGRSTAKKQLSTFSAQFPPSEWNDPDYVHFHSRATQTVQPDTTTYSVIKPRSSSATRSRDIPSSNGETPDASLDRRSRSSRSSFRLPRRVDEPSTSFPYRHRSASPAARKNGTNRHTGAPPVATRRLPSTSEVRTPPLTRKSYRHQRALPPVPVKPAERLNNGGPRQDDRYKLTNFTNNALDSTKSNHEEFNNRYRTSLFDPRRCSVAGTLDVDGARTRTFGSHLKPDSLRRETTFPVNNYRDHDRLPHVSAEDIKNIQAVGDKPRSFASIKNLQCAPMVITKVPPPSLPKRMTFTTTDTVTLKNIHNLSSAGVLDKARASERTINTLQTSLPSTNTTTVSIKQTKSKLAGSDASAMAKQLATNLTLEEKIESRRKSSPERTAGAQVKRIVEEQSVQSTVESTGGKLGNLKSTVDVNMEVVHEVGSSKTVTNISTCLSQGGAKTETIQEPVPDAIVTSKPATVKSTKSCKGTRGCDNLVYAPARSKLAEAKAAFFADSSNKGSADDSGFISTSPQPVPV